MKKGFTLVELLVVIVIVGLLVTMALPKYKESMEKGRGLEGIANAAAISDAANAYYMLHGDSYLDGSNSLDSLKRFVMGSTNLSAGNEDGIAVVTKINNFTPEINQTEGGVEVGMKRELSPDKKYQIWFLNQNGETTRRICTGYEPYCKALGADCSNGTPCDLFKTPR